MKERPSSFPCRWLLPSICLLSALLASSQNLKCRTIPTNREILLDSILIEPGSITTTVPFEFDESTQTITLRSSAESIEVCYRILSDLLTQKFQNRDISGYDPSGQRGVPIGEATPIEKEELFEFEGVEKFGAITRGVSFGNRQSVFVNSSLNLQMSGQVAENLNVSAVITDQNIPYQPEGNTQQIRDFDNVFIKLYNDQFSVTAGDIALSNPIEEDYFLKFYKNVQGLQITYDREGEWKSSSRISGSLSKGKFASILIPSVEGMAGPYRLRGPNGERFIIVLASSEKIFLDGVQMERGFDKDYIIDYNLGEVIFNAHIVITQFSRIRADFEYAEQFYSRSNLSLSQELEKDNVKLFGSFYRESDNPNNNFGFSLSPNDITQLQAVGDQLDQAFITGFDPVDFDENRILYERRDTLDLDGNPQQVFVNSTNPDVSLFSTTFSDVGEGNGDYVLDQATSNGRIYRWVSRQGGLRQGRYQPGAFVPLPNRRQMFNMGTEIKLNNYETIFSQAALTNLDQNLYSDLDDSDNDGIGYYGGIRSEGRESFISGYQWEGSVWMEYDTRDFSFIDRYRPIAYDRNWDIGDNIMNKTDLLLSAQSSWKKDINNEIYLQTTHRERRDLMEGWWHIFRYNQEFGRFLLRSAHSIRNNEQTQLVKSEWVQSRSDLSFRGGIFTPGYIFEVDENTLATPDSVLNTRNHFKSHELYLVNGDSTSGQFRLSYLLREDKFPVEGQLLDFLSAENYTFSYAKQGETNRLSADMTYRKTKDFVGLNPSDDEIVTGRVNWWSSFFKKNITQNLSLSTGNARELRREFVYLPVATGEGTHTWRDQNGDGIQDLSEFFEAINPDERNYAKIFVPTDEYITSFQTFYVHTIDTRFPVTWRRQGGAKAFLSKISANLNFNVNFKTTATDFTDRLNPFGIDPNKEDFISVQDRKRYTIFYNRNRRGFAGDFALLTSNSKQLLTQGFEFRDNNQWISNVKLDLTDEYTLRITSSIGELSNRSDFLNGRDFIINSNSYEPQLIWLPSKQLRVIGSYERASNENNLLETSQESSLIQRYKAELTWNKAGAGSLRGVFSWVDIDFVGDENTYLAYLLLDALRPGTNQTWQLNWQQKVSKGMQLSLAYNGRKSEGAKSIHTGNVQVTAFF